ncbi:ABC transporter permease [Clostridia bacterium]|nr:ABC transporter permease [Clostridia bacterium]
MNEGKLHGLRRNLRFIAHLIRLHITRTMMFRFSFFEAFFADSMLFIMQLLVFQAIYGAVDSIGGWSRGQMLIFIGTFSMINALNMTIYFFGVIQIPGLIREGGLDLYLTKPGNALLRLSFERVDLGGSPLLILSALIIAYGVGVSGVAVSLATAIGYTILVLLMTLLWYDMEVILRTLPFFFISTTAADRLEGEMLNLNFKTPGIFYKGALKLLFYFILPYGVMSTVPTQLITGALTPGGLIQGVSIVIIFTAFALWFWRLGLKHYKSASS